MEILKRLGIVLLVGFGISATFLIFLLGMSCIGFLFPIAIVITVVWYVIKYIATGEDESKIFK